MCKGGRVLRHSETWNLILKSKLILFVPARWNSVRNNFPSPVNENNLNDLINHQIIFKKKVFFHFWRSKSSSKPAKIENEIPQFSRIKSNSPKVQRREWNNTMPFQPVLVCLHYCRFFFFTIIGKQKSLNCFFPASFLRNTLSLHWTDLWQDLFNGSHFRGVQVEGGHGSRWRAANVALLWQHRSVSQECSGAGDGFPLDFSRFPDARRPFVWKCSLKFIFWIFPSLFELPRLSARVDF